MLMPNRSQYVERGTFGMVLLWERYSRVVGGDLSAIEDRPLNTEVAESADALWAKFEH